MFRDGRAIPFFSLFLLIRHFASLASSLYSTSWARIARYPCDSRGIHYARSVLPLRIGKVPPIDDRLSFARDLQPPNRVLHVARLVFLLVIPRPAGVFPSSIRALLRPSDHTWTVFTIPRLISEVRGSGRPPSGRADAAF